MCNQLTRFSTYISLNKIQTIDEIQSTGDTGCLAEPDHAQPSSHDGFLIPHFSTGVSYRSHRVHAASLPERAINGRHYLISGSTGGAECRGTSGGVLEAAGFSTETVHGPLLEDLSIPGSGWIISQRTAPEHSDNLTPSMRRPSDENPIFPRYVSAQLALVVENTTRFAARLRKIEAELKGAGAKTGWGNTEDQHP